jgi:cytochrome c biogenesis protein CcmG, thiol:disulfide interchange protein DsbE
MTTKITIQSMLGLLRDRRRWLVIALTTLALGAGWTWLSRAPTSGVSSDVVSPREGFLAPGFTLKALDGQTTTLSAQRGKVVVINLWASWCGPCRAEMPAIQKVYASERDRGLTVLAVNGTFQDSATNASAFAQQYGLSFPILLDTDGRVSRMYLLSALPSTYIVDRRGIIRSVVVGGPMSEAFVRSKIDPLLQEAP